MVSECNAFDEAVCHCRPQKIGAPVRMGIIIPTDSLRIPTINRFHLLFSFGPAGPLIKLPNVMKQSAVDQRFKFRFEWTVTDNLTPLANLFIIINII